MEMGDSKKRYVESANGLISWESFDGMGKLCAISVFDLREKNSTVLPFLVHEISVLFGDEDEASTIREI